MSYNLFKHFFNVQKAWGLSSTVDLQNCNPEKIRDKKTIEKYVIELCKLIDMKRYGKCHIVNFGEDERVSGYSMFQLIETSNISGHFANQTNSAYIDIFSCKSYDVYLAEEFTRKYFGSEKSRLTYLFRK